MSGKNQIVDFGIRVGKYPSMERVMIVGGPGSGKTTLALSLAQQTGLPIFHIDRVLWNGGWIEKDRSSRVAAVSALQDHPTWIIEGNFSETFEDRVRRSDTIIWLDIPIYVRLARVVKRVLFESKEWRPDIPDGCEDRLNRNTSRFLWYIVSKNNRDRTRLQVALDKCGAGKRIHHIRDLLDIGRIVSIVLYR